MVVVKNEVFGEVEYCVHPFTRQHSVPEAFELIVLKNAVFGDVAYAPLDKLQPSPR